MGIDRDPMRLVGSGASMGGIGNGAYGLGPLMFSTGGSVSSAPHAMGMSSFGVKKSEKKPNWFQRYVSNLTKSSDSLPKWARDPLGAQALLRKFAGQSRKGDNLSAALMPLNFMGLGLGARAGIGGAKAASAASKLNLSEDTIRNIDLYKSSILKNQDEIAALKSGEFFETYKWADRSGAEALISVREDAIAETLAKIALAEKVDMPPGGFRVLSDYTAKPTSQANDDNRGIIQTMLTRKNLDEGKTLYRGLSDYDMAKIEGWKTVPAYENINMGKEWMKKHNAKPIKTVRWAGLASEWKPNATELIKESGVSPDYGNELAMAPFKNLKKGMNIGDTMMSDLGISTTESLDWAKYIATKGGTGGGENRAIAKILVGKNVKGIQNLRDLGIGGTIHDPSASEQFIAPFTELLLKQVNLLKERIPGQGNFVGTGDLQRWEGGDNFSRLIDEYVFEAVRTLPTPHIPNFKNGGLANYKLPSYEVGSPYIPEDQIAQLHKGERVLTAQENKNFSNPGPVTNNITINGADKDPKQIAQEVMLQLDRMQSKNNKTNLVGR
jgi:hypothetical protein